MKKFTLFVSTLFICAAFVGFTAGIDAQEFAGNSQNEIENCRVKSGNIPPLDLENIPEDAYYPGIIRVQFNPCMEKNLDGTVLKAMDNDYVKTGISGLDELNKTFKVYEWYPLLKDLYEISPASLNYKERHREWGFHLLYDFKLDKNTDLIEAIIELEKLEEVKIAEPVFIPKLIEPVETGTIDEIYEVGSGSRDWIPNDPSFSLQYGFHNTGQFINGVYGLEGMDTNAAAAWEIEKGNPDVIVAIMDSGVDYEHEDIEGNMWPEIGPLGENTSPGNHGTHVAGTVSAVTNNDIGVAGLAGGSGNEDGVRIMSVPILDGYNTILGFQYAADNGAAISQNSWSIGPSMPGYLMDAIDYFNEHGGGDAMDGGITVFSAGNNNSSAHNYPGAYEGTMAVASHDHQGYRSDFSNFGDWVDIIAPGSFIYSLNVNNFYNWSSGTSMSAPHVSGAAALVVSHAYGILTNTQLWDILIESANPDIYDHNPAYEGMLGSGRLDAYAALMLLYQGFTVTFDVKDEDGVEITDAVITFDGETNDPGDYVFIGIEEGDYDYMVEKEGYLTYEGEATVEDDITIEITMTKTYTVTFNIEDDNGNNITDAIVTFDGETNDPGDYVFDNVLEGDYDYIVEKEGYITVEEEIAVEEDKTVDVTLFEAFSLTLSANPEEGGTVEGAGEYKEGDEVTINAIAEENEKIFRFVEWTGDTGYVDDPDAETTTVTMPASDVELTANFQDVTSVEKHDVTDITVFPNPTREKFTVKSNEMIKQIRLIDISGQIIKDIPLNTLNSTIKVNNLKSGIYFLEVQTEQKVITERVKITR